MDLNHADKLGTNGGWAAADVYFIAVPFISHEPCKGADTADFMPVSSSKKSLVAMQLSEHKFNNISKIVACLDTTFVARRWAKGDWERCRQNIAQFLGGFILALHVSSRVT